ncbi:MAG: DUF721 domain-containing protein [Azospirillaceae bacterium]
MSIPRPIGQLTRTLAARVVGRKALGLAVLIRDWPTVAGEGAAGRARPDGISFPKGKGEGGTLTLRTDPADALELQHDLDRLLERINRHVGHALIARVRLVQAPHRLPDPAQRRRPEATLGAAAEAALEREIEGEVARALGEAGSPELRHSLALLGRSLYRRSETDRDAGEDG